MQFVMWTATTGQVSLVSPGQLSAPAVLATVPDTVTAMVAVGWTVPTVILCTSTSITALPITAGGTLTQVSPVGAIAAVVGGVSGPGAGDVIVLGPGGHTVVLYTHTSGDIVTTTLYASVSVAYSALALGDMDGNGLVDIVLLSTVAGSVMVLQQETGGGFVPVPLSPSVPGATCVAVGDVSGDGFADVGLCGPWGVTLLINGGSRAGGSFTAVSLSNVPSTQFVTVGDVDQDGRADVVTVAGTGAVVWYQNIGTGFATRAAVGPTGTIASVSLADVIGTGAWDLTVTSASCDGPTDSYEWWYLNTLSPALTVNIPALTVQAGELIAPVAVHVTEDSGIATLACVGSCGWLDGVDVSPAFVSEGTGGYSFLTNVTVDGSVAVSAVDWAWHAAHVSVSLTAVSGSVLRVTVTQIPGTPWTLLPTNPVSTAAFVAFAALVPDGPISTVALDGSAGTVTMWTASDVGRRLATTALPFNITGVSALTVGDFTGDGIPDVVTLTIGDVCVWAGDGVGGFLSTSCVPLPLAVSGVVACLPMDVNSDGALDVMTVSPSVGVGVLVNDGFGGWAYVPLYTAPNYCSLSVCDVDGDGLPDVVAYGCDTATVTLLLRDHGSVSYFNGTSSRVTGVAAGPVGSVSGACVDVSGDGFMDVVLVGPARTYLLVNNGSGFLADAAFSRGLVSLGPPASRANSSVDAADVNLDGCVDVFVSFPSGASALYINNCTGAFVNRATDWGLAAPGPGVAAFAAVTGPPAPDLYALGALNPRAVPGSSSGALTVLVLSRMGAQDQHGATVRVVCEGGVTAVRVVGGVTSSRSLGVYSVSIGLPYTSVPCNVSVAFPSGVMLTPAFSTALVGVIPASLPLGQLTVSLVPFVTAVAVSPSHGTLGIGGVYTLTLVAAGGETGLTPVPSACVVQGTNVTAGFTELGDGVYLFVGSVADGAEGSFAPGGLTFSLQLQDARGHVSPVFTQTLLERNSLSGDGVRPMVQITCGPRGNSSVKAASSSLCVSCADAGSPCVTVVYTVNGSAPVVLPVIGSGASFVVGPLNNGDTPVVVVSAVDAAGNNALPTVWTWTVDLNFPMSTWLDVPVGFVTVPDVLL